MLYGSSMLTVFQRKHHLPRIKDTSEDRKLKYSYSCARREPYASMRREIRIWLCLTSVLCRQVLVFEGHQTRVFKPLTTIILWSPWSTTALFWDSSITGLLIGYRLHILTSLHIIFKRLLSVLHYYMSYSSWIPV